MLAERMSSLVKSELCIKELFCMEYVQVRELCLPKIRGQDFSHNAIETAVLKIHYFHFMSPNILMYSKGPE